MACPRCGGLAVVEAFNDPIEDGSRMWFRGIRCLNCGCIEDTVIRANRLHPAPSGRIRAAGMVGGGRGIVL